MEPEYENMTAEQEAAEVQALSPTEQAKYRELTQLHQWQADIEKKMTGVSKIIKERTKARAPGLPVDLIERNVQVEPNQMKQDEIPQTDKPGTSQGYYLFIENDAGCIIEQPSGQAIQDTDTEQHLPTDLIIEAEATTYWVLEQDNPIDDNNAETISSTSMADYDREEVEVSLTTISKAFRTITQEYEKLITTVPHMSKIQAAQVIAKLPILPLQKQEMKMEKTETAKAIENEPIPGTSTEQPTTEAEEPVEEPMEGAMAELTPGEKDEEAEEESVSEYFRRYVLTGKGKNLEDKIQEACKEINYRNLVVLIAVRDYIMNQVKNIKEVAKKWGLSFSTVQRAMSRKQEHSVGGRQYAKWKKDAERQEGPPKKSRQTGKKDTTESTKDRSPPPTEPNQESSDNTELPDVPWGHT